MSYEIIVRGVPVPKGSAKAYVNKHTGRAQVMQDNRDKQKPWASLIAYAAQQVIPEKIDGPVRISLIFTMPRVKSHFGTGKNINLVKATAPMWHTAKPDLDKLVRCVKDALTGIAWHDDSQVCEITRATKSYGLSPGVKISIDRCFEF